jgi:hypothetical protein
MGLRRRMNAMDTREAEPLAEDAAGADGMGAEFTADAGAGDLAAIGTEIEGLPDAQLAGRAAANG